MRQQLLTTFDRCYILDLHGNSDIKEDPPSGIIDENVFDIKQGVSIFIGVRRGERPTQNDIRFAEVWGSRSEKYEFLFERTLNTTGWSQLSPRSPHYDFRPKDQSLEQAYGEGFSITDLMPTYSSGVITGRDSFATDLQRSALLDRMISFTRDTSTTEGDLRGHFSLKAKKGWNALKGRASLRAKRNLESLIHPISYRPFDKRFILFDESVVWTTARVTMDEMRSGENVCLVTARSEKSGTCSHFLAANTLVETKFAERTTQSAVFPLFVGCSAGMLGEMRRPNLNKKVLDECERRIGVRPDPLEMFDYVYACLHSPVYRKRYRHFLRSDFPRIPYPQDRFSFQRLGALGSQLRRLHLMEPAAVGEAAYPFVGDEREGKSKVEKVVFRDNAVWINTHQRFENAQEVSWSFYIGGYQPAQKWLKDRKGRTLDYADVQHYQRILKVLAETDRLMTNIDMPLN